MAKINLSEVEALCTAAETSLIKQTLTPALERLSAAEVKARIGRARKLRDKFVDKSRHQRREVRGKAEPRGARPATGDARTVRKAALFEDALGRLQERLGYLEDGAPKAAKTKKKKKPGKVERAAAKRARKAAAAEDGAPKKKAKKVSAAKALLAAGKKKKAARSAVSRKGAERPDDATAARGQKRAATSAASKAKREAQRLADTSQKKILAHVSSTGRRSQAKRDSR
ncbi:MAG: hypothetical protein M9894_38725 [Planctomycetes bacterium]|nr:hypothetical protein [Planctomycetota bacterium]